MTVLDARGRNFEQFMLHLDSVSMWLATIDVEAVERDIEVDTSRFHETLYINLVCQHNYADDEKHIDWVGHM
jgi:hypothetical protein